MTVDQNTPRPSVRGRRPTTAADRPSAAPNHVWRGDADLVADVRACGPDAYAELYRRHEPAALAYAHALTRDAHLAKDVVAEAFARVLAALLDGGGPRTDYRRYLFATVRNLAYRMGALRSREVIVADPSPPQRGEEAPATARSLQDSALGEAFCRLPGPAQHLLWLSAVEGWSVGELANALDVSPGTAATRAYRARAALRTSLAHVDRAAIIQPTS